MNEKSIQARLYPQATCFGCGMANPRGLQLQSFPSDRAVVAAFTPWPEHDNGLGFLNGGIITTLLDCHSGAAAFHEASVQGWPAAEGLPYPFVTSGIEVRFRRPAPLDSPVELRAYVVTADEDAMTVEAELLWDGKQRAWASSEWKRWRPRA